MTDEKRSEEDRVNLSQAIRRQDLAELGAMFINALAPLQTVIKQLGVTHNSINSVRRIMWLCAFLVMLGFLLAVVMFYRTQSLLSDMATLHEKNKELVSLVSAVARTASQTKMVAERTEEKANMQPTVQLVPETDPKKAKNAPVKLVIEAPAGTSIKRPAAPRAPAVKLHDPPPVPLPVQEAPSRLEIPLNKEVF